MDRNNQYKNAMTKPLLYGCIKKQQKVPSLVEFNIIRNSILKIKLVICLLLILNFMKLMKKLFYLMDCRHRFFKKVNS